MEIEQRKKCAYNLFMLFDDVVPLESTYYLTLTSGNYTVYTRGGYK